jgi:hypothetical protein
MQTAWDVEIGGLLADLSLVQQELLDLLNEKRRCLTAMDLPALTALLPREEELAGRLAECQNRRLDLLDQAARAGLPAANLRSVVAALPLAQRREVEQATRDAALRARLLAHQGLANWVVVQRTLLHLSQLLEIIATGGRLQPTYGKEHSSQTSGSLVDQAV